MIDNITESGFGDAAHYIQHAQHAARECVEEVKVERFLRAAAQRQECEAYLLMAAVDAIFGSW